MKEDVSINVLKMRVRAKIKELGQAKPFISGSFIRTARKCGNPDCQCAKGGTKHPCCMLSSKVKGKTKGVYIPVALADEVESWVKEHRRVKGILKEIDKLNEQIIRLYVTASRAANRNRKGTLGKSSGDISES